MQLRFHLLATGRFLTVLHHSVLRFNAARWAIKVLPTDFSVPPMPVAAFTLKHRTLSPIVHAFLRNARDLARTISARG